MLHKWHFVPAGVLVLLVTYLVSGIVCLATTSIVLVVVLYHSTGTEPANHLLPKPYMFEQQPVHCYCLTIFNSNQSGMLKLSNNNNYCKLHKFLFTYL